MKRRNMERDRSIRMPGSAGSSSPLVFDSPSSASPTRLLQARGIFGHRMAKWQIALGLKLIDFHVSAWQAERQYWAELTGRQVQELHEEQQTEWNCIMKTAHPAIDHVSAHLIFLILCVPPCIMRKQNGHNFCRKGFADKDWCLLGHGGEIEERNNGKASAGLVSFIGIYMQPRSHHASEWLDLPLLLYIPGR